MQKWKQVKNSWGTLKVHQYLKYFFLVEMVALKSIWIYVQVSIHKKIICTFQNRKLTTVLLTKYFSALKNLKHHLEMNQDWLQIFLVYHHFFCVWLNENFFFMDDSTFNALLMMP